MQQAAASDVAATRTIKHRTSFISSTSFPSSLVVCPPDGDNAQGVPQLCGPPDQMTTKVNFRQPRASRPICIAIRCFSTTWTGDCQPARSSLTESGLRDNSHARLCHRHLSNSRNANVASAERKPAHRDGIAGSAQPKNGRLPLNGRSHTPQVAMSDWNS